MCWIIEKAKEFQKSIYFCFIDYAKAFDCVDQQIVENSSRDENSRPHDQPPEKLICRSRSNSWNQAWTDRPVPNWERLYMSPNLFNFYAEYIKWNAGLDEAQAGIKIARRNININNLRYADDTTLMAESEEELNSLLVQVKEGRGKSWLKAQHSKD